MEGCYVYGSFTHVSSNIVYVDIAIQKEVLGVSQLDRKCLYFDLQIEKHFYFDPQLEKHFDQKRYGIDPSPPKKHSFDPSPNNY